MRAGPLSNRQVIDLLNGYFVPVYVINEDYSRKGPAPAAEKAERDRIFKEGHAAGLSVGSVHVYVLRPDGRLLDSMHVAQAAKATNLVAMLQRAIRQLGTQRGPPAAQPCPQAPPPASPEGSLKLHLVARSLDGKGAWSEFPVENWIVLTPSDQRHFVPPATRNLGDSWGVDAAVAQKILTYFYPATENNDVAKNTLLEQSLTATVVTRENGKARVRLRGQFKMLHSFYHKDDRKTVEAQVDGFADVDLARQKMKSLRILADRAKYGGGRFAVALRSVP